MSKQERTQVVVEMVEENKQAKKEENSSSKISFVEVTIR